MTYFPMNTNTNRILIVYEYDNTLYKMIVTTDIIEFRWRYELERNLDPEVKVFRM